MFGLSVTPTLVAEVWTTFSLDLLMELGGEKTPQLSFHPFPLLHKNRLQFLFTCTSAYNRNASLRFGWVAPLRRHSRLQVQLDPDAYRPDSTSPSRSGPCLFPLSRNTTCHQQINKPSVLRYAQKPPRQTSRKHFLLSLVCSCGATGTETPPPPHNTTQHASIFSDSLSLTRNYTETQQG